MAGIASRDDRLIRAREAVTGGDVMALKEAAISLESFQKSLKKAEKEGKNVPKMMKAFVKEFGNIIESAEGQTVRERLQTVSNIKWMRKEIKEMTDLTDEQRMSLTLQFDKMEAAVKKSTGIFGNVERKFADNLGGMTKWTAAMFSDSPMVTAAMDTIGDSIGNWMKSRQENKEKRAIFLDKILQQQSEPDFPLGEGGDTGVTDDLLHEIAGNTASLGGVVMVKNDTPLIVDVVSDLFDKGTMPVLVMNKNPISVEVVEVRQVGRRSTKVEASDNALSFNKFVKDKGAVPVILKKDTANRMAAEFSDTSMSKMGKLFETQTKDLTKAIEGGAKSKGGLFAGLFGGGNGKDRRRLGTRIGDTIGGIGGGIGKFVGGVGKGVGSGFQGLFTGIGKGLAVMGTPKALMGAATLAAVGGALVISGIGLKQFGEVEWEDVGKGFVVLGGLGALGAILSIASGPILLGAGAVAAMGAALLPFGAAALVGANALDTLTPSLERLQFVKTDNFVPLAGGIAAMGAALLPFGIGGAIAAVGTMTLPSIIDNIERLSLMDMSSIDTNARGIRILGDALGYFGKESLTIGGIIQQLTSGSDYFERMFGLSKAFVELGNVDSTKLKEIVGLNFTPLLESIQTIEDISDESLEKFKGVVKGITTIQLQGKPVGTGDALASNVQPLMPTGNTNVVSAPTSNTNVTQNTNIIKAPINPALNDSALKHLKAKPLYVGF